MRRKLLVVSSLIALVILIALVVMFMGGIRPAGAAPALLPASQQVDAILIEKAARKMTLYRKGAIMGEYSVRLGGSPVGTKMEQGDRKTPEGVYRINRRNPHSSFHLSLGLNYPTAKERKAARARGVNPGGDIFIHGQPNRLRKLGITLPFDWTDGCVAVSNKEIEDIFARVPIGTKVTIVP